MDPRQRFRTMPPSLQEFETRAWVKSLPIDELGLLSAIVKSEMDERRGREKYRMASETLSTLN